MLNCFKCGSFNYNDEQCPSCEYTGTVLKPLYASNPLIAAYAALTTEELLKFMIAQNRKYLEIETKKEVV